MVVKTFRLKIKVNKNNGFESLVYDLKLLYIFDGKNFVKKKWRFLLTS